MAKKYHIFTGSTSDDLKNERKELPALIIEMGHIPVMPDFIDSTGGSGTQLIKKNIEECDYFIVLVAHKYFEQQEAEYTRALKKGIPVIALIIDEKARWKASKKESGAALLGKLKDFKEKLRAGPHAFWTNTADLRQKAQSLLIQEMNLNPRQGWLSSDQAIDPSVANELSRLSAENEELKRRVRTGNADVMGKIRDQIKHALKVMALNKITLSFYYTDGENWENSRKFRYLRLFKLLVPELAIPKTTAEISRFLGSVLNPDLERTIRKNYPVPSNTVKKIMADFSLLKLTTQSPGEAWEVTEYGKELFSVYRIHQLERAFPKKP
jgi:hypothetical protein